MHEVVRLVSSGASTPIQAADKRASVGNYRAMCSASGTAVSEPGLSRRQSGQDRVGWFLETKWGVEQVFSGQVLSARNVINGGEHPTMCEISQVGGMSFRNLISLQG